MFGHSVKIVNDVEGWHHKLNRRPCKGYLPFYLLRSLLYSEGDEMPRQVQLVKVGKLKWYQRKQVQKVQGCLMRLSEDYNEKKITTSQSLNKCPAIYALVEMKWFLTIYSLCNLYLFTIFLCEILQPFSTHISKCMWVFLNVHFKRFHSIIHKTATGS